MQLQYIKQQRNLQKNSKQNSRNNSTQKFTFLIIMLMFILGSFNLQSQEKLSLSGYVKDGSNGEVLIGAGVRIKDSKLGARSNAYGFYSIYLPKGKYTIQCSYVGFEPFEKEVELNSANKLDINLKPQSSQTGEVVVTGTKEDNNVQNIEMSTVKVEMSEIKKIPALLGEVDIIRSIQLLPGITSVGEGSSGFNARGGGIDQNLILLDEAPIFNSSHLFGFFSVFNPDAVKDVKLIKGGIPAEYGGRLSSILDVRLKEGDNQEYNVEGGIGLIFSRLSVEGPIEKNKGSFIIAARRSYIDVLAKPFLDGDLADSEFNFYDLTLKANYQVGENDRLFLSGYLGRDVFAAGFKFNWGNATSTLRWNHLFGDDLFLNTTAIYSNYDYSLQFGTGNQDLFKNDSKIINYSIKPDFTYFYNSENTITFGGQSTFYDFVLGNATAISAGISSNLSIEDKFALESALYFNNEQILNDDITISYGLRFSLFQFMGEGHAITLNDTTAGLQRSVVDYKKYDAWEVIQNYSNFEPRLSFKYQLDDISSMKASYNRMAQYLHLMSNTTAASPLDVWRPSTNNIKPALSDQWTLGYFRNFEDNTYETSAEVFYKLSSNQVDYIDGANLFINGKTIDGQVEQIDAIETDLLAGDGRAYGLELYLKKRKGDINGWVSYTLGRSERMVLGINNNEWFANRFDRTHNLNFVFNYDYSKALNFSANFIYASGTPGTFPTNRLEIQGNVIPHNAFGNRNNFRIPPTHRLDLSLTYRPEKDPDSSWENYWVFSIYNVYNRRNAYSVYFQQNADNPQMTEAIRFAVIGSVVPSIAWNFSF